MKSIGSVSFIPRPESATIPRGGKMKQSGATESPCDEKPVMVSQGESMPSSAPDRCSTRPLRNWKHEQFARLVVAGTKPQDAYTVAGFAPNRANHNRLMRHLKDRIDVL